MLLLSRAMIRKNIKGPCSCREGGYHFFHSNQPAPPQDLENKKHRCRMFPFLRVESPCKGPADRDLLFLVSKQRGRNKEKEKTVRCPNINQPNARPSLSCKAPPPYERPIRAPSAWRGEPRNQLLSMCKKNKGREENEIKKKRASNKSSCVMKKARPCHDPCFCLS